MYVWYFFIVIGPVLTPFQKEEAERKRLFMERQIALDNEEEERRLKKMERVEFKREEAKRKRISEELMKTKAALAKSQGGV